MSGESPPIADENANYESLKRTHNLVTGVSSISFQDHKQKVVGHKIYDLVLGKDLSHFILSYPVKLLPDESNYSTLQNLIPKAERDLKKLLSEGSLMEDTLKVFLMEDKFQSVMEDTLKFQPIFLTLDGTYIPDYWRREYKGWSYGTGKQFQHELTGYHRVERIPIWAIESATGQASRCILEGNVRLIAISGQEAGEVIKSLRDMPDISSRFDNVHYISVSERQASEEINDYIEKEIENLLQSMSIQEGNFLLLLDFQGECIIDQQNLNNLMNRDYACVVLATPSNGIYRRIVVDLGIRMEYHLLPLLLFYKYARRLNDYRHTDVSPALKEVALNSLELYHGDLLAVVILALELQKEEDFSIWKDELKSHGTSHEGKGVSKLMSLVLPFTWKRKEALTKVCIQRIVNHDKEEELTATSMVSSLLTDGLVETEKEGIAILDALAKSRLLAINKWPTSMPTGFIINKGPTNMPTGLIIMREDIKDVLLKCVRPSLPVREEVDDREVIDLKNCQLTELPERPCCPRMVVLCLQYNYDIMMIPPLFFMRMPVLSTLNLSHTSIKTLPASISALVSLRRLLLRDCKLFLALPPEIGQLSELEVIDLEGTRVMYLPNEITLLQKLQSLKLSFYPCGDRHQASNQRISKGLLSYLNTLKEIQIDVNPDEDDDEWIADVKNIVHSLPSNRRFENIVLYVPETSLVENIPNLWASNYKLTVGRLGQRMISRAPRGVEEMFKQQNKYLHYANGESIPTMIKDILRFSNAFILDRHWTAKSLSEFTTDIAVTTELCLLVECNELQTIFDKSDRNFHNLRYLGIYYMKNLRSIWGEQGTRSFLYRLKSLTLCTCTSLSSIFTISSLGSLQSLEELVVEDCPKMERLVTQDCAWKHPSDVFLPSLKKMSLLELPKLVSISNGLKIAPKLEKLVIFYCPKLESISEVVGENLRVIKGEIEWWDSLSWRETGPLASIFISLKRDGDLMAQFSED